MTTTTFTVTAIKNNEAITKTLKTENFAKEYAYYLILMGYKKIQIAKN